MSEFVNYDISPYLPLINKNFASQIRLDEGQLLDRRIHMNNTSNDIISSKFDDFLNLVDANLGSYYKKIDGPNWKQDKLEEMKHEKLVYISYYSDDALVAFLSFALTFDEYELCKIFYLYEIHVASKFQNARLGSRLIDAFHSLNENPLNDLSIDRIEIFKLTVFSNNEAALNWYQKLNYKISCESSVDRILRSGKIIRPDYYILVKHTNSLMLI